MSLRYGSVCSGIESASVAWAPLGWEAAWFSEIEKFPAAVLAHRFPTVPNRGDMTGFEGWARDAIDLMVGGTPCQSFSVAGLRAGLADPRGNLMLAYLAVARRFRPAWLVWENVPGVRSMHDGRDLGAFLGGLGQLGYGWAYRSLDAQYADLAQRRERVFVIGYLGDWRPAAEVLFERQSLSWHTPPGVAARKTAARRSAGPAGGGRLWRQIAEAFGAPGAVAPAPAIADVLTARSYKGPAPEANGGTVIAHALTGEGFDASEDGTGRGVPLVAEIASALCGSGRGAARAGESRGQDPLVAVDVRNARVTGDTALPLQSSHGLNSQALIAFSSKDHGADAGEISPTLRAMGHDGSHANAGGQVAIAIQERAVCENPGAGPDGAGWRGDGAAYTLEARQTPQAVAFAQNQRGELRTSDISPQLTTGGGKPGEGYPAVMQGWAVRRLLPVECERLQGFADNFTRIAWRGRPAEQCPDGPRYKALGNAMDTHTMRWIGERIAAVAATL